MSDDDRSASRGVPLGFVEAYAWFDLAESAFPESDQEGRRRAQAGLTYLRDVMTDAQIDEAQRLARERRR